MTPRRQAQKQERNALQCRAIARGKRWLREIQRKIRTSRRVYFDDRKCSLKVWQDEAMCPLASLTLTTANNGWLNMLTSKVRTDGVKVMPKISYVARICEWAVDIGQGTFRCLIARTKFLLSSSTRAWPSKSLSRFRAYETERTRNDQHDEPVCWVVRE